MTDEDLDALRADEACKRRRTHSTGGCNATEFYAAELAARLAREGWKPEDPLLKEAREIIAKTYESISEQGMANAYREGLYENTVTMQLGIAAIRRGIEMGRSINLAEKA